MRNFNFLFVCLFAIALTACSSPKTQQMSTMEVRSLQTKEYQTSEELTVYKALINALLDRGFTLKSSDASAGVVIASFTSTELNKGEVVSKAIATFMTYGLNWVFGDNNLEDTMTVDVSANVTEFSGISTVRINAIAKRLNSDGEIVESKMVIEPEYYDSIFQQIEKSVFIEKNIN